jgi:hypothetical protein
LADAAVHSHSALPIFVADDLSITLRDASVRLTPSDAFDLAEVLMRKGYRRALTEEAIAANPQEAKSR